MIRGKFFNKSTSVSLLEQLSLNLGNFLFFIFAANFAGPEQFGLFATLIVGAQVVLSLAIQWVFLPITSKSLDYTNRDIIDQTLKKILILAILSPLFIWLYLYLLSNNNYNLWQYLLVNILALSMVVSDASRYYLIRIRNINALLTSNTVKWILSFILLFVMIDDDNNKHIMILNIFVFSLFVGMVIQLIFIWFSKSQKKLNNNDNQSISISISTDNPLFNLGMANIFNTIAITLLFNKVNIVAFGALQAFRSLVNIFPFFLQFLETHFSAIMVLKGKSKFVKIEWLVVYFGLIILLSLFLEAYGSNIINMMYGSEFSKFDTLFLLLFIIVCVQSLSRLLSVQLRLQENYRAFNYSALILWVITVALSGIFYILEFKINYINILEFKINYIDLLFIMLFTAIIQMLNFIYYSYRKR